MDREYFFNLFENYAEALQLDLDHDEWGYTDPQTSLYFDLFMAGYRSAESDR